jgi:hypothetical protein
MPEPVPFVVAIETAERELDRLAGRLDVSLEGVSGTCAVVLGIARQAFEVYRGLRRVAIADPLGITGTILLRSLVDAAILLRWIEGNPGLRVEMYFAEADRQLLASATGWRQFRSRRHGDAAPVFDTGREAEMKANLADVRARARKAGEPIGDTSGPLLPSAETMATASGDSAMWEAYHVLYRVLSPWTHSGATALAPHRVEQRQDGPHLVVDGPYRERHLRAMACPSVSHLLGSASRICGLGFEGEARLWQDAIVEWPAPIDP